MYRLNANKKLFFVSLFFFLIFLTLNFSYAQQSNILYYMPGVPQTHLLNPATQPRCSFYLGLPLASPLQLNVENSAFSINDVVWFDGDSTITFMHPDADQDGFLKNFGKLLNG